MSQELKEMARQCLKAMSDMSDAAEKAIDSSSNRSGSKSLGGNLNTWNDSAPVDNLSKTQQANIESYRTIVREPFIARVSAIDENRNKKVYYICRTSPPKNTLDDTEGTFLNSRAPLGRLASGEVGDEISVNLSKGEQSFEILERIEYNPGLQEQQWDSKPTIYGAQDNNQPITIPSLRALLIEQTSQGEEQEGEDILSSILATETGTQQIFEGIRRNVITRMSLRDQPILDRYQDEIFRLPLQQVLLITGPPGTGKTTTLIRRLGQKLDAEGLSEEEQDFVGNWNEHRQSWIMFTPTECLRLYLKEAFNREAVPAPDERIQTWEAYKHRLAVDIFHILKSASRRGLIVKKELPILTDAARTESIAWYEDFASYFAKQTLMQLKKSNDWLIEHVDDDKILELVEKIDAILGERTHISPSILKKLDDLKDEIQEINKEYKEVRTSIIHNSLKRILSSNKQFLDELSEFIRSIGSAENAENDEEEEDSEAEEDHFSKSERTRGYNAAIRALAREKAGGKKPAPKSKNAQIISWLGDRLPPEDQLVELGKKIEVLKHLRAFVRPMRWYVRGVPSQYRSFRKEQIKSDATRWYDQKANFSDSEVHPLELDGILLLSLKNIKSIFTVYSPGEIERNNELKSLIDAPAQEQKNQVFVDEATDFSPIQLACMMELSNPKIRSFFACGDFNQRITAWGTQTKEQMQWACSNIEIRPVDVVYRQSKALDALASRLITGEKTQNTLPRYVVEDKDIAPVLIQNTGKREEGKLLPWLKEKILQIGKALEPLPSIAIFVHNEQEVEPVAEALGSALEDHNIKVESCLGGKVIGQDGGIRVFDVQHIKGLEFEAVFFIAVDTLAEQSPALFDKYLYVGITRAATYLGITCESGLPKKIKHTAELFTEHWKAV